MRSQAEAYAIVIVALVTAALIEATALTTRFESTAQRALVSEALKRAEQLYAEQGPCIKPSISTVVVLALAYNSTYVEVVAYSIELRPGERACLSVEPDLRVAVLTSCGNLFTVDSQLKTFKY